MTPKKRMKEAIKAIAGVTGVPQQVEKMAREISHVDRGTQLLLAIKYKELRDRGTILRFDDVEFRNYSQNGEDGILLYVFSLIGTVNKKCIEICAGDGLQCNCANLIFNHGWTGLLFDGDPGHVSHGHRVYKNHPDTFTYPPKFVKAWITAEHVNELIASNGFTGEVDLLSLDIDGMDYWVWKAIEVISPRVVIAEIQAIWGSETSVTVPYRADFKAEYVHGYGIYSGASLPAFVKLGKMKGYRLVGCQRYGFNAVFIRNDIGQDFLPEISANQCFSHPFAKMAYDELRPLVVGREWQEV